MSLSICCFLSKLLFVLEDKGPPSWSAFDQAARPGDSGGFPSCAVHDGAGLKVIGAILLLGYCFIRSCFVGTFSSWDFFLGGLGLGIFGVFRPGPCMAEPVSKLFVASSVNFVSLHWDCFVKNILMGQIKVRLQGL